MRSAYTQLKQTWGGYAGYDAWFSHDLNNAQLALVATYREYVPAFRALLRECNGDFTAFYRAARKLGELPEPLRKQRLQQLAGRAETQTAVTP